MSATGSIFYHTGLISPHYAPSAWDEFQVHLAAPLAGRVRQAACCHHGSQASRLNEVDRCRCDDTTIKLVRNAG